jgi:hypothetical protein
LWAACGSIVSFAAAADFYQGVVHAVRFFDGDDGVFGAVEDPAGDVCNAGDVVRIAGAGDGGDGGPAVGEGDGGVPRAVAAEA